MSKTWKHDLSCIGLGVAQTGMGILFHPLFFLSAAGSFSGLLLSPDLDWSGRIVKNLRTNKTYLITREPANHEFVTKTRVYGRVCKRWLIFRYWWHIYANIMKHRGLSHVFVLGTLTRLLWLFFLFIPLAFFLPLYTLIFCVGLALADTAHILLD